MHRLLERLDALSSTLVPLAYLCGMMAGTAAYFSGLVVDAGVAVGVALAVAVELHGFLEQRRVRYHFGQWMRSRDIAARNQLLAHVAILAALVAFQAYNSYRFLDALGHPDLLRALVLPLAFLVSGALAPLTHDAGDELRATSRAMLRYTMRKMSRQWRLRVRSVAADLSPIAVALMEDAGDTDGARRIRLIAAGLDAAEGRTPAIADERAHILPPPEYTPDEAFDIAWDRPPTGPGSPVASRRRASKRGKGSHKRAAVIRLQTSRRDVETAIRALLGEQPGMSIRQLSKRAGVSESTASKYRRIIMAEGMQQTREAMAQ